MNDLFREFEFIWVYIYNLLILTKEDWIDHIQKSELTLNKLMGKRLKSSIEKYFLRQNEMGYLGFWVTRNGVKLITRKIEAITNMRPHTSRNNYKSLWV